MSNSAIITGWGCGHAYAAAAALQKYPDAPVLAASARRLPHLLEELAETEEPPRELLILGISLAADPGRLKRALRHLQQKGTQAAFITVYPPPSALAEDMTGLIDIQLHDDADSLAHACRDALDVREDSAFMSALLRQIGKEPDNYNDAERLREDLVEAAASRYRRFQDAQTYPEVIGEIARNLPLSDARRAMIAEYRRNGTRELRGHSRAVQSLRSLISRVADQDCRVLVTGETGVGKETVASLIHGKSSRSSEPFIAFNCADLSPQLLESRLFGHEKGAFTGAENPRKGAFELADGGTLFLDEVGELSPGAQAGLLRVLQEGCFYRLGGEAEIETDVRVIAATNRDLEEMIRQGMFRQDLYYRLNTVVIEVPPLRERPEDIKPIAGAYLWTEDRPELTEQQVEQLTAYPWPGNVRELQNMLERSGVLNEPDFARILPHYLPTDHPVSDRLEDAVRAHCQTVYDRHGQNKTQTAKALGISVNTLKKYLKETY